MRAQRNRPAYLGNVLYANSRTSRRAGRSASLDDARQHKAKRDARSHSGSQDGDDAHPLRDRLSLSLGIRVARDAVEERRDEAVGGACDDHGDEQQRGCRRL